MAAFYLARYCVIYATARGGSGEGGAVNCEKGWMAGSQGENGTPTIFGTASDLEMAALWLVPPRQLPVVLPLCRILRVAWPNAARHFVIYMHHHNTGIRLMRNIP